VREQQLGDVIDDYCVKCRRLTNHAIVSLVEASAAKVRCRTCYNDHDYRHETAPPTKRELLKQKELFNAVLSKMDGTAVDGAAPASPDLEEEAQVVPDAPVVAEVPKVKRKATS
jgi:hypothetical protein